MKLSVIVPTYNRPKKLEATVRCLLNQTLSSWDYEVIVMDDASTPPAVLPESRLGSPRCILIRFEAMLERAVARNTAAVEAARGELVLFSDDDLICERDFLESHLLAHEAWPGALVSGEILLPPERMNEPGVRFRQEMERRAFSAVRGPVGTPNFGSAANMSIRRDRYLELGGFDPSMVGIEDQDFSMRHSAAGGMIVYLPEAVAIHDDDWLDFRSFCRRQTWASACTVLLAQRYPNLPENTTRAATNGPLRWGRESVGVHGRKLLKSALERPPALAALFGATAVLERLAPSSSVLRRLYTLLLGIHLQRGYRLGLARHDNSPMSAPAPALGKPTIASNLS